MAYKPSPGLTADALFAVIATAVALRSLLLLRSGEGALSFVWMIALYALISGGTHLLFALRMRQLAREMAHA